MTKPKPEAPREWLMNGNCPECKRLWDEAERVKKERDAALAALHVQSSGATIDALIRERDHLRAENARMREALGRIARVRCAWQLSQEIASKALAGDGREIKGVGFFDEQY